MAEKIRTPFQHPYHSSLAVDLYNEMLTRKLFSGRVVLFWHFASISYIKLNLFLRVLVIKI